MHPRQLGTVDLLPQLHEFVTDALLRRLPHRPQERPDSLQKLILAFCPLILCLPCNLPKTQPKTSGGGTAPTWRLAPLNKAAVQEQEPGLPAPSATRRRLSQFRQHSRSTLTPCLDAPEHPRVRPRIWRRGRDSTPRSGLPRTHGFPPCSFGLSDTSPPCLAYRTGNRRPLSTGCATRPLPCRSNPPAGS